ncbi:MAG: 50S ribosomal protein L25/general stress protein Ctc [Gammaproteobacteria bacterium]|nr:50S ribosomal protein L25/general stress protein Ctc [Pseudomonadota bacterium]MCH9662513.1 50S ribosomal protein L25/general stress protein Ctc [Gammaproteobacteria bacterium]
MTEMILQAELRQNTSRGQVRRLRRLDNKVPAVLYGGGEEPVLLTLHSGTINRLALSESFYTHILKLDVGGKKHDAVVKDIHRHPCRREVLHLDFLRVREDRPLTIQVPIHVLNESSSEGVRAGGIVSHLLNELEVRCLPKHIPEAIEVDISGLSMEQTLHLSQITLPEGVELLHAVDASHDPGVVAIHKPRTEAVATEDDIAVATADGASEPAASE